VAAFGIQRAHRSAEGELFGLGDLPLDLGAFHGHDVPSDESVFAVLGADEMLDRVYVSPEEDYAVRLSVVFARGWRALHSPRDCFRYQGWALIRNKPYRIPAGPSGRDSIHASLLIMAKSGTRIVTVYTFTTGRSTTGRWLHHSARMAAGGSLRGGALVVAVVPSVSSDTDARAAAAAESVVRLATEHLWAKWDRAD
jgi:hypothetical protein